MVAVTLMVFGLPLTAQATTFGGSGRIAFSAFDASKRSHIWTMAADGSEKIDLTAASEFLNIDPDWSPDGASLAFSRGSESSDGDIWRMEADGGNPLQLTAALATEREPEWSPDGSIIVFESGPSIVTVSSADGSGRTVLAKGRTPTFSPSGTKIAFTRFRNGDSDVYTMNADGTDVMNLTRTPSLSEFNPDWAPDGRTIAFQRSHAPSDHEIWTMRPGGGVQYLITDNTSFDGFPKYSPDGVEWGSWA